MGRIALSTVVVRLPKIAFSFIRHAPEYPWQGVESGLRAAGYTLESFSPGMEAIPPDSLVVTWNDYGFSGRCAAKLRAAGARHIIMENGYFPLDPTTHERLFAVEGWSPDGKVAIPAPPPVRFPYPALFDSVRPWRSNPDGHVLVCGQRGGDYSSTSMPLGWPLDVMTRLHATTKRPIVFRPHPGRARLWEIPRGARCANPLSPLAEAVADAWAVVVWTSNAATDALMAGVPVFYEGPSLAVAPLARRGIEDIESPYRPLREIFLRKLALSVWSEAAIATGALF